MDGIAATNGRPLLTCWKDIASYMGKGVRTVQRWEQSLELPVRRPLGNGYKSAVAARPADLDQWLMSRWARRGARDEHSAMRDIRRSGDTLGDTIKLSQQLRAEHHEQLVRLRSELQVLVQNCTPCRTLAEIGISTCSG